MLPSKETPCFSEFSCYVCFTKARTTNICYKEKIQCTLFLLKLQATIQSFYLNSLLILWRTGTKSDPEWGWKRQMKTAAFLTPKLMPHRLLHCWMGNCPCLGPVLVEEPVHLLPLVLLLQCSALCFGVPCKAISPGSGPSFNVAF